MIVQLLPLDGLGRGKPVTLDAAQILVLQDNGTPIYIAAHYGPDGAVRHATPDHDDFNNILRNLGIAMTTVVDNLHMPKPPPGARLIAGPRNKEK